MCVCVCVSVLSLLFLTAVCVCVLWPDCPQVQCVEQYVAQQADELTLEPTEIVNVIRKTNEGKRSRDHRQTGAVPPHTSPH